MKKSSAGELEEQIQGLSFRSSWAWTSDSGHRSAMQGNFTSISKRTRWHVYYLSLYENDYQPFD